MISYVIKDINEKMRKQIYESDIVLLSELNLEPSERQFIRDNSAMILEKALDGIAMYNLAACYFMMDVGQRAYNNGMYWDNFWELSNLEKRTQLVQSRLSALFKSTIEDYNLAWIDRSGRTYVNMILMHAFIPDGYSSNLFDFMFLFYKSVLNGNLDGMDAALNNLADNTSVEDTGDKGEIFDTNLILSMKLAFSDINIFGPMARKILRRIDASENEGEHLGIYEDSFKNWIAKKLKDSSRHGTFGEKIRLYYDREFTIFKIFIPEIAFYESGDPYAYIKDANGNMLGKIYLDERMFKGYTFTNPKYVNISDYGLNLLDNFTITAENNRFESVDKGFIIFSDDGFSSRNMSRGINFVARKPDVTIYGDSSTVYEDDNFLIDMLYLERGDSVKINDVEYFIHKPWGNFFDISDNELNLVCKDSEGNKIGLYSRHPSISLESEENKLDLLRLAVWKDNSKIEDLSFDACLKSVSPGYKVSNDDKIHIELDMETILKGHGEGIYKFKFNQSSRSLNYLYIPGFTCTFDKDIYFGSNGYLLINWNTDNRIEFNSKKEDSISFPFETDDGKIYDITVEIPSFRYSFNRTDWFIFNSKKYYYKELNSEFLYIKTPNRDGGYLSISVPRSKPLKGSFEDGINVFNLTEITSVAGYFEIYGFHVYYNWREGQNKYEKAFYISVNAEYRIEDGQVRVVARHAGNVSYRLVIDYESEESVTVPFEDDIAEFDEEGFEEIIVQEVFVDDFGGESVTEVTLIPKEIKLEFNHLNISQNKLPERIEYQYGNYKGDINPEYFESMVENDLYNEEFREEYLEDFFNKNAYGDKMPNIMARKLYSEIEAQFLKIQLSSDNKHDLIRLFNKYINVRNEFAKAVLSKLKTSYPDDNTLEYLIKLLDSSQRE